MWKNTELHKFYEHKFDFKNQTKDTYDDWIKAFENSVKKRAVDGCFIGLSSGYDSGALTKEMLKQGVEFKAYVMFNHEKKEVLDERLKYIPKYVVASMDKDLWQKYYDYLKGKINDVALADKASMAVAYTFETANKEGRTICISGQGGDEINSDYALFPKQSHFKGKYPNELYEWPNFREHMQREYLNEIEEIAELYGIEVRYPFLDTDLIQEFLWLTPELKNKNYKAPLFEYLTRNQVPFEPGVKRGFQPIRK
jgi:asparagine synthetase B (glutamine-hydrolysing)